MSIPERILKLGLNPGALAGITLTQWIQLLIENRFVVDRRYWPRAVVISLTSTASTALGGWEYLANHRRWESIEVPPPLIVLGVARSGTTYLHKLLTTDSRFGYLTFFQGRFPRVFLSLERPARHGFSWMIVPKRFQDNVSMHFDSPAEDEDALCSLCLHSQRLVWVFGQRWKAYDRFRTFDGFSAAEAARWKAAFLLLLRKLTLKYVRPLVLKSPGHTARIPMLLDVVPDAKFVFIHRNPADVLRSAFHMDRSAPPLMALQTPHRTSEEERVMSQCSMMNAYFQHRSMIPKGHLMEVGYENLVANPIGTVRDIYEALALPDFSICEPQLRTYVKSNAGYQKNRHKDLPAALRRQAARECRQWFDEWGYPV